MVRSKSEIKQDVILLLAKGELIQTHIIHKANLDYYHSQEILTDLLQSQYISRKESLTRWGGKRRTFQLTPKGWALYEKIVQLRQAMESQIEILAS